MGELIFKYDLKSEVKIKALKAKGIIIGYHYGQTGIQYQVAYFLNGERNTVYLYDEEIDVPSDEDPLGFNK